MTSQCSRCCRKPGPSSSGHWESDGGCRRIEQQIQSSLIQRDGSRSRLKRLFRHKRYSRAAGRPSDLQSLSVGDPYVASHNETGSGGSTSRPCSMRMRLDADPIGVASEPATARYTPAFGGRLQVSFARRPPGDLHGRSYGAPEGSFRLRKGDLIPSCRERGQAEDSAGGRTVEQPHPDYPRTFARSAD